MLDPWFDTSNWRADGHEFLAFAQDGTGGYWMLWKYAGLQGRPPVIFLGSEGERGVVCNHLDEWIGCLGSGRKWWDSHGDEWADLPVDEDPFEDKDRKELAAFPDVIRSRGGAPVADPSPLTAAARARHPDLGAWVDRVVHANSTPFERAKLLAFQDPAGALAVIGPELEAGWTPDHRQRESMAVWAMGAGQPQRTLEWTTRPELRAQALLELGRPDEAVQELPVPVRLEDRYLKATALEAAGRLNEAHAVRRDADRATFEGIVAGVPSQNLAERAERLERAEARQPSDRASVRQWLRVERALTALERGLRDEANSLIESVVDVAPWVEKAHARVRAALERDDDPVQAALARLEAALESRDDDEIAHARGRLGLLLETDDPAASWSHLEAAVMQLPGSSQLSKDAFAALDRLEQAGHAP